MQILFYLAVVIITALVVVAGYYHWQLYKLRKDLKAMETSANAAEAQHRSDINGSIQILCRAVVTGQVGYVEASIRISALMDQLGLSAVEREPFIAFDKMAQSVRHIPILESWKKLPRDQKLAFEREMQRYEDELNDFILDAANKMLVQCIK